MKLPRDIGPIHFVGIGGIGMSGIAEVLINLGYKVQGSDASDNANVKRLREKGATVFVGHDGKHVEGADVLVVSSAIKRDNPELVAARELGANVVGKGENEPTRPVRIGSHERGDRVQCVEDEVRLHLRLEGGCCCRGEL